MPHQVLKTKCSNEKLGDVHILNSDRRAYGSKIISETDKNCANGKLIEYERNTQCRNH